jgi:hypothetical protein
MRQLLSVKYRVPILGMHPSRSNVIEFTRWLPQEKSHGLSFNSDGISILLYVDETCLAHTDNFDNIDCMMNVMVDEIRVGASVWIENIELIEYILNLDPQKGPDDTALGTEFERLGDKIELATKEFINRLVDFLRIEARHYWLCRYDPDRMREISRDGVARFDRGPEFRWRSTRTTPTIYGYMPSKDSLISEETWLQVSESVTAEKFRPWPAGLLLADAYVLRDQDKY